MSVGAVATIGYLEFKEGLRYFVHLSKPPSKIPVLS